MNPGERLFRIWLAAGLCFSAGAALPVAGASPGYLPRVGPPPLRFRPAPMIAVIAPRSMATAQDSTPADSELPPVQGPELPSETEMPSMLPPPQVPNPTGESLLPPVVPAPRPSAQAPAANELLIISPQMLIEYFKPQAGSTNATPARAIVPVQFTPATPAPAPESRAIYKTE